MNIPGPLIWPKYPEAARWLNALRQSVVESRIKAAPNYRVRLTTGGSFLDLSPSTGGSSGGSAATLPFTLYSTGTNDDPAMAFSYSSDPDATYVVVRGGTVFWQDKDIIVADSLTIAVPLASTDFKVWLQITSEFTSPPTFTIRSGAGGWSGYPVHPNTPNRKYLLLATCVLSSPVFPITKGTLTITENFHGGDVFWPPVFGVYF